MLICPRCTKSIDAQAVTCPYCHNPLKAFGHPGIPLHQSTDDSFLCDRCTYHLDDSCNFPSRPQAKSCTLFHDQAMPLTSPAEIPPSQVGWVGFKNWLYRHRGMIAIALLILISVAIALNY